MKRLLLLLVMFLCVRANAQIVGTVRQSYGPYQRSSQGYEPALASSRNAVLLAWSEVDPSLGRSRIRFGLLDFHGRLISPITTVPSAGRADSPTVATDGTGFRVAYFEFRVENGVENRYGMAVDVDPTGFAAAGPRELRAYGSATAATFPIVYWTGSSYSLVDRPAGEAAAAIDHKLASADWITKQVLGGCFLFQCWWEDHLELEWWSVNGMNGSYRPSIGEPGALAMTGNDHYAAVAWNTSRGVQYLELTNGMLITEPVLIPASVPMEDRPGLGCDDTHCLLAYNTTAGDVYGVLYRRAHPGGASAVPIELGSQFVKPHVQVLQNGRFLVTYVSAPYAAEQRMAGRIVTTEPEGRRRAVR